MHEAKIIAAIEPLCELLPQLREAAKPAESISVPSPTGSCWCGCGARTSEGRYFVQGHDLAVVHKVIGREYCGVLRFLIRHGYSPKDCQESEA